MQCCIILTVNLLTWRKCHLFFTEKQNHLFPHMTYYSALYKKRNFNFYALAFRGTDQVVSSNSLSNDMWTNILQGAGFETAQYNSAVNIAGIVNRNVSGLFMLTGHSLGGGLACAASLATGKNAVTFNPAGLHRTTAERSGGGANWNRADDLITRYVVKGEILNSLQNRGYLGILMPDSIGRLIALEPSVSYPIVLGSVDLHSIDSVLNAKQ